ncbi:thiamine biosynthesis protein ApbE [Megasphaera cerevisiae DSM 20462]|jgi:thiamine biosynthesis lipoprotein|uniref:FAD:protein FMN transferase n=1 Tax=Megasphaera cerevisiae DSM 20462 TaxID=1122219 RepID=A0A0J6WTV3_9FIRM|nr:FAD:protein FMN transferase [Megasphaera cerevisiae]KMO86970.1 thiamine biosynthesis protein ApbE [Megasphaera cerevisiae DSM 20462]OKY54075.1 thiamine biosynthesis protein ApbE [Megasphaera cerevisiae]SJZ56704.1 thiamine biosynthesis lipoprotein [Megasphaera cerevisiae DSM 20462]
MEWKRYAKSFFAAAFIVSILGCSGCAMHSEPSFDKNGIAMDTTISLSASGKEAKEAVDEGFQRIEQLDALARSQDPNSDVSHINQAAGQHYVQVDPAVYEMVAFSKMYAEKSNGMFDITVGPLISLWDIGNEDQHIPAQAEITDALKKINYKDILLRPEDHSIMLAKPGMAIDLGSVAKGFAVDEVRKIYEAHHITRGLINMGSSSMYAIGKTSKGKAWNIGIKHPRSDKSGDYLGIVSIENQALSTSGDYERYFIQDGVRYCHIFDPRTGYPAAANVMSDSIAVDGSVEHAGMLSDVLTTVVFVMGPEKGLEFVNTIDGIECEITSQDGALYMTDNFKAHFSDMNKDFHLQE